MAIDNQCRCGRPLTTQEDAAYRGRCEECFVTTVGRYSGGVPVCHAPGLFGTTGGGRRAAGQRSKMTEASQ